MSAPVVVLLTTYPIAQPRSGGQLRARALVEAYEAGGFEVRPIAVTEAGAFPRQEHGPHDLEFPLDHPSAFEGGVALPQSNDLQAGWYFAANEKALAKLAKALPAHVDVFHLEQPWLLPAVQRLLVEPRFAGARLVYGSQNVEGPLKASICRQLGVDGAKTVAAVESVEAEACRRAALTLAVSPSDLEAARRLGATNTLLAPNGIHASTAAPDVVERWRARLGHRRVALFVGSAHPPNAAGFIEAFGEGFGFVPPDCCLVAAGRVGTRLDAYVAASRFPSLARSRLVVTGEVETADLSALKALAEVFVLPIFEGGGSNIKTSEALLSGKPVLATTTSLRGFDAFSALPELTVCDSRAQFVEALRRHFTRPAPVAAPVDPLRASLLWENTLAPVAPAVRALLEGAGR